MYKKFAVSIQVEKLLMHNGQLSDPMNPYAKAMKAISSKRQKTDADLEQLANIEFEAGLYLDRNRNVIIPGRVFESVLVEGARRSKEGKLALAGSIVENDAIITYDGGPLSVDDLIKSPDHRLTVSAKIGTSRVMRTRPMFHNVKADFEISLAGEAANGDQLRRWIVDAMNMVGLCDWRPRYGRGRLVSFVEVAAPIELARAA